MTTRKTLRRVILGAAVSTASMANLFDGPVYGMESASKTAPSRIQRVQYQSGQTGGQPNSAVTQELNRMFQESGQPMPSMNPQDLPNAQVQHPNVIRQKPSTTQKPAQKNFLQRFIGKVSGQDRKEAQAATMPPVPPDYRQPSSTPVPPTGSPNSAQARTGQPATAAPGNVAPLRTAQAAQPNAQARPLNQPNRPVPAVPGPAQTRVAATVSQPAAPGPQQYVQPGTAPAFMPSAQVSQPGVRSTSAQATRTATPVGIREPIAAPPADDDFEDPFADSETGDDAAEPLDLDSLMVLPTVEAAEATAVPEKSDAESVQSVPAAKVSSGDAVDVSSDAGVPDATGAEFEKISEESNPFTGVRLNETEAELSGPGSTEDLTEETDSSPATFIPSEDSVESFGSPAPPMEEFESDLPAIGLPAVDDFDTEADSPNVSTPSKNAAVSDAPQPAAESDAPQSAAVAEPRTASASSRSADAERLEQAAEQDRRIQQQRLIQSRAGQPGFKGFCPVELRDSRNLVNADPKLEATFGLQTYTFSSVQAKAAFEADPSRYAPAAGGNDVVLLVNSGEEQAGMLDYALWYRDRLYLFRSRETMALFNSDPGRFANQY